MKANTTHIIETPRLMLRRYRITDLDDYWEYISQAELGAMYDWETYTTKKKALERLEYEIKRPYQYAIVYKENNKVIGSIELRRFKTVRPTTLKIGRMCKEISYLLNEKYWGKGIMPEALKGLLEYAFLTLEIPEIVICHAEANVKSAQVQDELGFKVVARYDNYRTWIDGNQTACIYRKMTRDEFLHNYVRSNSNHEIHKLS